VRLVVGLGNPGDRYAHTRHNAAWAVLDELAVRHTAGEAPGHATFRARRAVIAQREVELLQPLTYMNLSGAALLAWRERHGIEEELLVVSDDVYLPLGMLRVRASGSTGGHRGLESIEAAVGGREYARLRIGVGAPTRGEDPAENTAGLREHVLEAFAPDELPALEATVRRAADAVECWLAEGTLGAMNQFNRKVDPGNPSVRMGPDGDHQEESET
jgi:PTH1 family peptidyl-tRNA hydrolase